MPDRRTLAATLLLSVGLGACAGSPTPDASVAAATPPPAAPGYQLTEKELKLDCKALTGRIQVRLLQIRGQTSQHDGTAVARGAQMVATSIYGGSRQGTDPGGQLAADIAKLEAYNRQLAAKKCKTFNLEDELRPKHVSETPRPR